MSEPVCIKKTTKRMRKPSTERTSHDASGKVAFQKDGRVPRYVAALVALRAASVLALLIFTGMFLVHLREDFWPATGWLLVGLGLSSLLALAANTTASRLKQRDSSSRPR